MSTFHAATDSARLSTAKLKSASNKDSESEMEKGTLMSARPIVFLIYILNFFLELVAIIFATRLLENMDVYLLILLLSPLVLSFCGILIAYWLLNDEDDIEQLKREIQELKK